MSTKKRQALLDKAVRVAIEAHTNQERWNGDPYIVHPFRVALTVKSLTKKTIAMLHDVVEDTQVTLDHLSEEFPDIIVGAVDALTRRKPNSGYSPRESYRDYIRRLAENHLAKHVKLADLRDNLAEGERVGGSKAETLRPRYEAAIKYLTEGEFE